MDWQWFHPKDLSLDEERKNYGRAYALDDREDVVLDYWSRSYSRNISVWTLISGDKSLRTWLIHSCHSYKRLLWEKNWNSRFWLGREWDCYSRLWRHSRLPSTGAHLFHWPLRRYHTAEQSRVWVPMKCCSKEWSTRGHRLSRSQDLPCVS